VDLKDNPERFTGYSGPSAAMVWKAIYEENCFDVSKEMTAGCHHCESERKKLEEQKQHHKEHQHIKEDAKDQKENSILVPPEPAPMKPYKPSKQQMEEIFSRVPKGKGGLQQLIQDIAEESNPEESCLEKRVYYRLISGLHASISIHICDEWFNQTTGEWGPNLDCFISRVGMHPERLENIYFDYVVLLRAVTKISDYLAGYEFCTGDDAIDHNIMNVVNELVDLVKKCPPTFDEKLLFQGDHKGQVQQLKHQFRDHFRNVTRIMVSCCRPNKDFYREVLLISFSDLFFLPPYFQRTVLDAKSVACGVRSRPWVLEQPSRFCFPMMRSLSSKFQVCDLTVLQTKG